MTTISGLECSIIETTHPGLLHEDLVWLEIKFDRSDLRNVSLTKRSLFMFKLGDRRALEEYMGDVAEMNEENAIDF